MKFRFLAKKEISKLPKDPGVYCLKNKREVLYIGKAANIKERVKSHFSQPLFRDNLFINEVRKIGYFKTDSEIEALILEASLIKKYQPKYNIVWRDDKNYFYVGITNEDFPWVFLTHQIKMRTKNYEPKTKFIGPFVDGSALKQTLKILRKVFPYRSCRTLAKHPCLWQHLERCPAPCLTKLNLAAQLPSFQSKMRKECRQNIRNLIKVLQGKKLEAPLRRGPARGGILKDLKKEMKKASVSQNFEKAKKIRDQITALKKVLAHSKIFEEFLRQKNIDWLPRQKILQRILKTENKISRIEAYDVSNIQGQLAAGSMITFINGQPDKSQYRKFKIKIVGTPNDTAMIKEVLSRRFNHPEWQYPDLILIDGGISQLNAANSVIKQFDPGGKQASYGAIPVISLAKKHNELYFGNQKKPIFLKSLPREIFNLILQLRDQAHRFAISYHKKLRKKYLIG